MYQLDKEAPVFSFCPEDKSYTTDLGSAYAKVSWESPVASDNSGAVPDIECIPMSNSNLPMGETLVSCTSSDGSGNNNSCSLIVNVLGKHKVPLTHLMHKVIENLNGKICSLIYNNKTISVE